MHLSRRLVLMEQHLKTFSENRKRMNIFYRMCWIIIAMLDLEWRCLNLLSNVIGISQLYYGYIFYLINLIPTHKMIFCNRYCLNIHRSYINWTACRMNIQTRVYINIPESHLNWNLFNECWKAPFVPLRKISLNSESIGDLSIRDFSCFCCYASLSWVCWRVLDPIGSSSCWSLPNRVPFDRLHSYAGCLGPRWLGC